MAERGIDIMLGGHSVPAQLYADHVCRLVERAGPEPFLRLSKKRLRLLGGFGVVIPPPPRQDCGSGMLGPIRAKSNKGMVQLGRESLVGISNLKRRFHCSRRSHPPILTPLPQNVEGGGG